MAINELQGGTIIPSAILGGGTIFPGGGGGGGGSLQPSKSVSYTPSETAISANVTPDYGFDAMEKVVVSVGAISSTYVGSGVARNDSTDLTASGATVTAPAGYYSANASKAIPNATLVLSDAVINLDGSIEAEVKATSGGYVSQGNHYLTVEDVVTMKGAQTYYPSSSDQSIAEWQYLTGAQTIKGVTTTNLTAANIKKDVVVQVGDSADPDRIVSVTGAYEGGGVGDTQLYYNNGTGGATFYAENSITPSDAPSAFLQRLKGASHLKTIKCMQAEYGGTTYKIVSAFQGCSLLEEVTLLNGISTSGYAEDLIMDCPNIKTFTTGGIGCPNTVGMGTQSGIYQTFRNITIPFDIIIYTTATDLASLPSYLRTGSPWGATNATIIYKNSVTGEVLT